MALARCSPQKGTTVYLMGSSRCLLIRTELTPYVAARVGQQLKRSAVLSAFERDFASGSRSRLQLRCAGIDGVKTLTEIHVYLRSGGLGASLPRSKPLATRSPKIRADCPTQFYIDPNGHDG